MTAYRIGVVGCAGRMGRMLIAAIAGTPGCAVAGGSERPGSAAIGRDVGTIAGIEPLNLPVLDDADDLFAAADAVLDFTAPAVSVAHAALAARHKKVHVIGTTGLESDQIAALERAGRDTAIVFAPNMSLGVNLLLAAVEQVARSLGPDWDIEIVEMHHRHKVDAPSGTALKMGDVIAGATGRTLADIAVYAREGHTGERKAGTIGFATVRGGDIVGDHTVMFAGTGERIEITHRAASRMTYAIGSMRAARFLEGRRSGLFDMFDVLGLN